jgi:hypothetical protein
MTALRSVQPRKTIHAPETIKTTDRYTAFKNFTTKAMAPHSYWKAPDRAAFGWGSLLLAREIGGIAGSEAR